MDLSLLKIDDHSAKSHHDPRLNNSNASIVDKNTISARTGFYTGTIEQLCFALGTVGILASLVCKKVHCGVELVDRIETIKVHYYKW